jgi:hypothetical protein
MEATLTVHRLHLPMQLRKTIARTNVIESAFSIVEQVCKERETLAPAVVSCANSRTTSGLSPRSLAAILGPDLATATDSATSKLNFSATTVFADGAQLHPTCAPRISQQSPLNARREVHK